MSTTPRLIFLGGFLGAGKTTAIAALAQRFQAAGLRVGTITNDQATQLVDTTTLRGIGLPVAEVAGGCFCCRFPDLTEKISSLGEVDIVLAEPVGSCTDVAATVLAPLRRLSAEAIQISPLSVLVDPVQVQGIFKEEGFVPEVRYIFDKQLEEADEIILTKSDTLSPEEQAALQEQVQAHAKRPVRLISAVTGTGMEKWASALTSTQGVGHPLAEIDYDTYAAGEAALGWLNLSARLSTTSPITVDVLLRDIAESIQDACLQTNAAIAHLKISFQTDTATAPQRVQLTQTGGEIQAIGENGHATTMGILTVNARIQADPVWLEATVRTALQNAAGDALTVETCASFRPSYPTPTYRG